MAQYKVLQDIEAEDKLLGPLSMRQFIYAIMVVVLGFVAFRLFAVRWYLGLPFLPPMLFFGLLAAPFGRDQPTEVWLLAKIRFFLKPRKRLWDQTGIKELVTITVPKKIEQYLTKGFSQDEVTSRLKALSSTLDTRGWAVKNVDTPTYQANIVQATPSSSDRLIAIDTAPREVPSVEIKPTDDVLDEQLNPVSQRLGTMVDASEQTRRQELLEKVHTMATEKNQTTTNQPPTAAATINSSDEEALLAKMRQENERSKLTYAHMRTLPQTPKAPVARKQPIAPTTQQPVPDNGVPTTSGMTPDPDILETVKIDQPEGLRVSHGEGNAPDTSEDEVVVSLH